MEDGHTKGFTVLYLSVVGGTFPDWEKELQLSYAELYHLLMMKQAEENNHVSEIKRTVARRNCFKSCVTKGSKSVQVKWFSKIFVT